jgi:uncharacterized membrane protein YoaK (UPF0700 family)
MDSFERREIRSLLLLSLTAGSADAAGYLGLGRVFTSNMTGNLVLLGIDLGQRRFGEALHSVYVLAVFLAGVALGTWMTRDLDGHRGADVLRRITPHEALLLVIFAVLWSLRYETTPDLSYGLVPFLAVAMGLQSAAFHRLRIPGVATTAITSTMTTLVSGVVGMLSPRRSQAEKPGPGRFVFQGLFLLLYLAGALLSGIVMIHQPRIVGFFPAAFVLYVLFTHLRNRD